jgi:hypothetical protein
MAYYRQADEPNKIANEEIKSMIKASDARKNVMCEIMMCESSSGHNQMCPLYNQ